MPALLARILARLALLGVVGALRRRAMRGTAGPHPPWRTPGTGPIPGGGGGRDGRLDWLPPAWRQRLAGAVELGGITLQVVEVGVLCAAVGVLVTAGTASAVLAPRWLGALLLALAAIVGVLLIHETRAARRRVRARRRRLHDERLRVSAQR